MKIKYGYNKYLDENDQNKMLLDVGILKLKKGEKYLFQNSFKEKAILIWSGKISLKLSEDNSKHILFRKNIWQEPLMAMHCSKKSNIEIIALEESEMLLQSKTNDKNFKYKLYDKNNCKIFIAGKNYKPSTSIRYVIDIFNIQNAPYSNMVLGEVFSKSGHWSGYPPHNHNQPEVYIYRFNKPQGFGIGLSGKKAKIVKNYDSIYIPSGNMHQNSCAPGYQMYFAWMIPNLPNDPWNKRNYCKEHEWINKNNLIIKDSKDIN